MKHLILSVHDVKGECYQRPLIAKTKGEALRGFIDAVNDPNFEFFKHPEDYTLFHIGFFDDGTGLVEPLPTPEPVGKAIEFVNAE